MLSLMTKLNLASNRVEVIDENAFVGFVNLVELNFAHNLLTHSSLFQPHFASDTALAVQPHEVPRLCSLL
jgi:hypothetical protein